VGDIGYSRERRRWKMEKIREFEIVPSKDITAAKYVRYREAGGWLNEYIILEINGERYKLSRVRFTQLFRYLDAKVSDIRRIYDYNERDRALMKALRACDTALRLSVIKNHIVRVTSKDFTAIPHGKVLQIVEKVLKLDYEDRKVEFDNGMFARWTLRSLPAECARLGEIVSWQLWAYNRNDGKHGLKIGGGFTVLACNNGAVKWKGAARVRIVHRGDYNTLLDKIRKAVAQVYFVDLPQMAYEIEQAQQVKAAKELVEKLVRLYPQWIQKKLQEQLRTAHTVWDVSNAFSWVATHEPVTFNQRMQLSNHAVEVLKLVERR